MKRQSHYYVKYESVNIIENSPYAYKKDISSLITYYVSTNGNDENDGLSKETPFATLKQAMLVGATHIAIEKGEYPATNVKFENKNDIHIYAYDDNEAFEIPIS